LVFPVAASWAYIKMKLLRTGALVKNAEDIMEGKKYLHIDTTAA
jgi:hypothetical protein